MEKQIKTIKKALKSSGAILEKYFVANLKASIKSAPNDFYTEADVESEKNIVKILQENFSDYNIIAEEKNTIKQGHEYTFVIDPLDATYNFFIGIPYFSIIITLLKGKEAVITGVYHPILRNLYLAEKNKGVFLNDKKIQVNKIKNIKQTTISFASGYSVPLKQNRKILSRLEKLESRRIVRNWSPGLDACLMACGKIELLVNYKNELYDHAGIKLMVREAGGKATSFSGNQARDIDDVFLASNGTKLHQELIKVLK